MCSKSVTVYKNCIKSEYLYCKIGQNEVQSCTFLYKAKITFVNGQNLSKTSRKSVRRVQSQKTFYNSRNNVAL